MICYKFVPVEDALYYSVLDLVCLVNILHLEKCICLNKIYATSSLQIYCIDSFQFSMSVSFDFNSSVFNLKYINNY